MILFRLLKVLITDTAVSKRHKVPLLIAFNKGENSRSLDIDAALEKLEKEV
jgi:hypothetical protein